MKTLPCSFVLPESDEDTAWNPTVRETKEELAARGIKFLNRLWTRKEKEIAIVAHSGFLFHTLATLGNDCHPIVKKEMCKHFSNCELRSMVLVDKSMSGSDAPITNYPEKIPPGPDLSSDDIDQERKIETIHNSGVYIDRGLKLEVYSIFHSS